MTGGDILIATAIVGGSFIIAETLKSCARALVMAYLEIERAKLKTGGKSKRDAGEAE